jgi:hypothetical protein
MWYRAVPMYHAMYVVQRCAVLGVMLCHVVAVMCAMVRLHTLHAMPSRAECTSAALSSAELYEYPTGSTQQACTCLHPRHIFLLTVLAIFARVLNIDVFV